MITPTAEEATMTTTTESTYGNDEPDAETLADAEDAQKLLVEEMTDAEAIETLVRTDEERLSDATEKPATKEGINKRKTQGTLPQMFHMLSQIDDEVFVAWNTCKACRKQVADCLCKSGPTEPHYITKWRMEWIDKRDKAAEKASEPKKNARRKSADTPLAATVEDAIEAATEAVEAASTEEVSSE